MRTFLVMSIAAVALAPCAAGVPQEASEATLTTSVDPVVFDASVPAVLEVKRAPTGHLLVKPLINGQESGWFIFDTGAGICCVSPKRVAALGLRETGSVQAKGVGGAKQSRLLTADALRLGPASFKNHVLMETDLDFLTPHMGEEICGVIGFGVISKCVVEMDLKVAQVALHDPAEPGLEKRPWEPLVLQERLPTVKVRYEGHEGLFRLDTGANGHVSFHPGAIKKWDLLKDREVKDAKLGGVGGFVSAKQGTLEWIEIGGVRTEQVPARFVLEERGAMADADRDGTIGVELLLPFTLFIDYPHNRIAFVKRLEREAASDEAQAKKPADG